MRPFMFGVRLDRFFIASSALAVLTLAVGVLHRKEAG